MEEYLKKKDMLTKAVTCTKKLRLINETQPYPPTFIPAIFNFKSDKVFIIVDAKVNGSSPIASVFKSRKTTKHTSE